MLKEIMIVGAGNLINAIGGFVFVLAIAKTLSIEEYGFFALMSTIFILTAKLTELGTTSSFVTLSIKNSFALIKSLGLLKLILGIIGFFFGTFLLYFYKLNSFSLILIFAVGYIGYALNDFLFAIFQYKEKFALTALVNALPATVKLLAAVLILFGFFKINLLSAITIYTFALLSSLICVLFLPKLTLDLSSQIKLNIKRLINVGFPGGISQALNLAIPTINATIIFFVGSSFELGIFSLADKISTVLTLVGFSLFTVFLPKNAKYYTESGKVDLKSLKLPVVISLLSTITIVAFADLAIRLLFEEKYVLSTPVLQILSVSAGLSAITSLVENYFFILNKTKKLLLINCVKIATLVVLGTIFTTNFGYLGLAATNVCVSLAALLITFLALMDIRKQH